MFPLTFPFNVHTLSLTFSLVCFSFYFSTHVLFPYEFVIFLGAGAVEVGSLRAEGQDILRKMLLPGPVSEVLFTPSTQRHLCSPDCQRLKDDTQMRWKAAEMMGFMFCPVCVYGDYKH